MTIGLPPLRELLLIALLVASAIAFFWDANPHLRKRFGMQSLGFMFAVLAVLVLVLPS